jgi:hypothetical protein
MHVNRDAERTADSPIGQQHNTTTVTVEEFQRQPGFASWQDAEKVRHRRSRIVQTLNVPQRVRLGPSLAAALLDGLFEHPAGYCFLVQDA